ncbi:NACHT domain-containing protein [Actinoplanes xinjiangensis]|uniref:NACHT domain-containing protein n=1 Tax=Actinoplanes xinjiangensis TaxID=512350 RepID=UPI003435CD1A
MSPSRRFLLSLTAVTLLSLAAALGLAVAFTPALVLDIGDQVASMASAVIGFLGLILAIRTLATSPGARSEDLALAEDELARVVRRQWETEALARGLTAPEPMRLSWRVTHAASGPGRDGGHGPAQGDVTAIASRWRSLPQPQLVIIGPPGAGKTSAAVLLVCQLLAERRPDDPIPVLFTAASWKPRRQHFDTWLAEQLVREYRILKSLPGSFRDLAARLVERGRILPVIDGLDELPPGRRSSAMAGLTIAVARDRPIVMTCRTDEFQELVDTAGPLPHATTVSLEEIPVHRIGDFLAAGQNDGPARWKPVITELRDNANGPLATALARPLMVYLARTAYARSDRDPAELRALGNPAAIEESLIASYVPAVYAYTAPPRSGDPDSTTPYPAERARQWLSTLATALHRLRTMDFAWWHLERQVSRRFTMSWPLASLLTTVVVGLLGYAVAGPRVAAVTAVSVGLAMNGRFLVVRLAMKQRPQLPAFLAAGALPGGAAASMTYVLSDDIRATVTSVVLGCLCALLIWALANAFALASSRVPFLRFPGRRLLSAAEALLYTMTVVAVVTFATTRVSDPHELTLAVVFSISCGIVVGAVRFAVHPVIRIRSGDARLWLMMGRLQACTVGIGAMTVFGWTVGYAVGTTTTFSAAVEAGTAAGVAIGTMVVMMLPWGRYLTVRCGMTVTGHLPWRLIRFLEDASRRGVLRQVGSTWQFRHARLQDHLVEGAAVDQVREQARSR